MGCMSSWSSRNIDHSSCGDCKGLLTKRYYAFVRRLLAIVPNRPMVPDSPSLSGQAPPSLGLGGSQSWAEESDSWDQMLDQKLLKGL